MSVDEHGVAAEGWDRLMAAAQEGDARAYRTLLGEVAQWLRRYYARRLAPGMVEDAVQDVLLAVHEKRHTFDPSRSFGPWLSGIARYKWIDRLRALKTAAVEPLDDEIAVADHGNSVIAAVTTRRLLDSIKPQQAQAIRLVKLDGLTVEEASVATGQSASLIKVNIHRGLKRLADIIRENSDAD